MRIHVCRPLAVFFGFHRLIHRGHHAAHDLSGDLQLFRTLGENAYPEVGAPNLPLIDKLISCRRLGAKVILWTCREGELLTRAVEFCRCYGLEFDAVNDNTEELKKAYGTNPRKIGADFYIDDKAVLPTSFLYDRRS